MGNDNFKFYVIPSWDDITRENVAMQGKRVIVQPPEMKSIMYQTFDVNFRGTLLNTFSEVLYKNKLRAQEGEPIYTICKVS